MGLELNDIERIAYEQKEWDSICSTCHEKKPDVKRRYSFGEYAGKQCEECCYQFADACGLVPSPADLCGCVACRYGDGC